MLLLAVAVCLRLGWWQLGRAITGGGSPQNLAYALQWPLFAGFAVYLWWRMLRFEVNPPAAPTAPQGAAVAPGDRPAAAVRRRYRPEEPVLPPDEDLDAYNRYLAGLDAHDRQRRA